MRLEPVIRDFITAHILKIDPEAKVYLFGSRTDDQAKGGDIDIMIVTEKRMPQKALRELRREFYKSFGWQKIDLINFLNNEENPFKNLISKKMIQL